MISMTRTLLAMSVALAPVTLASPINRRVDVGKDINFDLKIWSTEKTDSMMPTHFAHPDQNMTATSNAISYTAPDTPPDVKRPKDSQEDYFIIGQLHFNQVPGNTAEEGNPMRGPRKMYLYTGQQTPGQDAQGQKAVTCDVTFESDPNVEDLNWFLRAGDPFNGKKPDGFNVVCSGDSGVVNSADAVAVVATTSPDGSVASSTAAGLPATTVA